MLKTEAQLEAEIAALPRKAELIDAQEDAGYGKGRRGDELPKELQHRQDRLNALRKAKAALEAEAAADNARRREQQACTAEEQAAEAADTETEAAPGRPGSPPGRPLRQLAVHRRLHVLHQIPTRSAAHDGTTLQAGFFPDRRRSSGHRLQCRGSGHGLGSQRHDPGSCERFICTICIVSGFSPVSTVHHPPGQCVLPPYINPCILPRQQQLNPDVEDVGHLQGGDRAAAAVEAQVEALLRIVDRQALLGNGGNLRQGPVCRGQELSEAGLGACRA
jgi:hypothetical protein